MSKCHHPIWLCFHDGQATYRSGVGWITIPEWLFWASIIIGFIVFVSAVYYMRTRNRESNG